MVSIVIPVYNAEKYLAHCIVSVLKQTYRPIQIILVNDNSIDNSLEICQSYQRKYPSNIFVIDKKCNEGVDLARFSGLEKVFEINPNGYVCFLDSDDWLERDAIKNMVSRLKETDADVVSMQMKRNFCKGVSIKMKSYAEYRLFDDYELHNKLYISFFGYAALPTYMCGKLYKAQTLRSANLRPSHYKMCEDHMFNMYLFPHINSWVNMDYYGYIYRYGGTTAKFNPLWPELKNQNLEKREFAYKYDYLNKVKPLLDIELKNIFYSDVAQRLAFCSELEFMSWIKEALDDDVWLLTKDSSEIESNEDFHYIYNKDISGIVTLAQKKVKQNPIKVLIKRFFVKLNNWFG